MTALGRKAAVQPGRMAAIIDSGHSEAMRKPDLNVRFRPEADAFAKGSSFPAL
jgi:hypothetical protein